MILNVLKAALLAAIILAAMWLGSLWIYDHEKMEDALRWRWAELNDEPLFSWPFNLEQEIIHGNGIRTFGWRDGVLSGDHPDPYFYLNLEGRYIDAGRFTEIRLRLWSPADAQLRIFHHQVRDHEIHASELIAISAGWQTLIFDLKALNWYAKNLNQPEAPEGESSWGGEAGVVTALRIDPVRDGAFGVDWIELGDPERSQRTEPAVEVENFRGLDDPLFEQMRAYPGHSWVIARAGWLRTPETLHWERQHIAREFPSAIVLPRPPDEGALAVPPLDPMASPPFLPAFVFVAAMLFLVVRDQVPPPWRSVVAVISLLTLIEAYIYWLPSLDDLWRVLLAIPVLGAVWEMAPKLELKDLLGEQRAWLWVAPVLVASSVILAFEPLAAYQQYSVSKELVTYFLWALFQQFVIAVLILSRLKPILGRLSIVVCAGIFGFLHFPNFALMVATFLLGIALLLIYERYRNLLAIAAAHAFLAVGFNSLALQFFWLSRTIGPTFGFAL